MLSGVWYAMTTDHILIDTDSIGCFFFSFLGGLHLHIELVNDELCMVNMPAALSLWMWKSNKVDM